MQYYLVEGGKPLHGSIPISGAKNSVLPILAATLLTGGRTILHNCPDLRDVRSALEILEHLGCRTRRQGSDILVDSSGASRWDVPHALMREMRSSVIFLGPILARFGKARLSLPGGCEIGQRPIDLHLAALRRLGAEIREPEIADLQAFLQKAGADIGGSGESVITVSGGMPRRDVEHTILPDRIETATYLCAAAACGGEVTLTETQPEQVGTVLQCLSEAGCTVRTAGRSITLLAPERLGHIAQVRTMPYPGFPTDAQAPLMAAACTGQGASVFLETIFENRYRHVSELARMGADIRVSGRTALVNGAALHGASVRCTDLRGGAALVIAALAARGESRIEDITHIDRGYEHLAEKLTALGGSIRRLEEPD